MSLAVILHEVPGSLMSEVLSVNGIRDQRTRALPAWLTGYLVLAMPVAPRLAYQDVARLIWRVVPDALGISLRYDPPTSGAIVRARQRLGIAPFITLADRLSCRAGAGAGTTRPEEALSAVLSAALGGAEGKAAGDPSVTTRSRDQVLIRQEKVALQCIALVHELQLRSGNDFETR
ncbi:hypothetical protein GCM10027456_38710 [Kineosporia babensis]